MVLAAAEAVLAEPNLLQVDNFEQYPVTIVGRFMGREANGVAGGEWSAYPEGNRMWDARVQVVGDNQVLMVRNQAGGRGRAVLLSGMTDPVEPDESGVLFFRFRLPADGRENAAVSAVAGVTAADAATTDAATVVAGFALRGEAGAGVARLTALDETEEALAVIEIDRWYDAWISIERSSDTYDLYIAPAVAADAAVTLPQVSSQVLAKAPIRDVEEAPLGGAIFIIPDRPRGAQWLQLDEVHWNGSAGIRLPGEEDKLQPDPLQWRQRPAAVSPTRVSMAVAPPVGEQAFEYYFENAADPQKSSGWQRAPVWVNDDLTSETSFEYRVKARFAYDRQRESGWSKAVSVRTPVETDTTAPEPDPAQWERRPEVVWGYAAAMSAAAATDPEGNGPVEYYFANLTDPSRDSGWQREPAFIDADLNHESEYAYRVKARDRSANFNETEWSETVTILTAPRPALFDQLRKTELRHFPETDVRAPVRVFANDAIIDADGEGAPLILYIQNHAAPRVGQEPDEVILRDYLADDYLVVTVDFGNEASAASPALELDLTDLLAEIHGYRRKSLLEGTGLRAHDRRHWFLPAGYRLERDVEYFDLERHGAFGTKEQVLQVWNNNRNLRRFNLPELSDPEEMRNPDGSPLDWKLRMDVIYPSNSIRRLPVIVYAASNSQRTHSRLSGFRPHMIGFKMRGYAVAHIDHCYNPLARHWAYGHFEGFGDGYSLAPWNGMKADSAAIRYLRMHADKYGLDRERFGMWSISKATYSANLMANPRHEEVGESRQFHGFPEGAPEEQPWQGWSSRVGAVALASSPRPSGISAEYVPTLIAVGRFDGFNHWERWVPIVAEYESKDVNHLALWMEEAAHDFPLGHSSFLDADLYELSLQFFDQHLNQQLPPEVLYTLPKDGRKDVRLDGRSQALPDPDVLPSNALGHLSFLAPITVHFGQPIRLETVTGGGITLRDENGNRVEGTWSARRGDTYLQFEPDQLLEPEKEYRLQVTKQVTGAHEIPVAEEQTIRFQTVAAGESAAGEN